VGSGDGGKIRLFNSPFLLCRYEEASPEEEAAKEDSESEKKDQ